MRLTRPRFTMRLAMVAPVVMAIALGMVADRARRERRAVRWVEAVGGRLVYRDQLDEAGEIRSGAQPAGPTWVRKRLGDEYVRSVAWVDLSRVNGPVPPEGLGLLSGLSGLRYLRLEGDDVDDRHMVQVGRLTGLEDLGLSRSRVTDAGLAHLARLRRLRWLDLSQTSVKGPGLVHLTGLDRLESLILPLMRSADTSLAPISGLVKLEDLELTGGMTDAGLPHLYRLGGLKTLVLSNAKVTRAGLDALLPRLPRLKCLGLHYADIYSEDIRRLHRDYPGLDIQASW